MSPGNIAWDPFRSRAAKLLAQQYVAFRIVPLWAMTSSKTLNKTQTSKWGVVDVVQSLLNPNSSGPDFVGISSNHSVVYNVVELAILENGQSNSGYQQERFEMWCGKAAQRSTRFGRILPSLTNSNFVKKNPIHNLFLKSIY